MKNALAWIRRKVDLGYLLALLISLSVALLLGAGIIAVTGRNPLQAYGALVEGAFSNWRHIGNTLEYAMVLCLCGLACDIGSRAGIFNVGGEGQLLLGGLFAAQIGVWMDGVTPWLTIPCAVLGAVAVGGLYAFIPGILKVKLKVNEVITTIMLNSVAVFLCGYFAKGPWKNSSNAEGIIVSERYGFTPLLNNSNLSTAIFASVILTFLVWYVLQKTTKGYEMRLVGDNPRFARFAGIKADRIVILAMVVSGMMCGLVGMFRVYGIAPNYKFITTDVSNEYYFEGLMVAMIAQYQPIPTILISLIFAVLKIGAMEMQSVGVPIQIYWIIQTTVIFCMAAQRGVRAAIAKARERRAAERDVQLRREGGAAHE